MNEGTIKAVRQLRAAYADAVETGGEGNLKAFLEAADAYAATKACEPSAADVLSAIETAQRHYELATTRLFEAYATAYEHPGVNEGASYLQAALDVYSEAVGEGFPGGWYRGLRLAEERYNEVSDAL